MISSSPLMLSEFSILTGVTESDILGKSRKSGVVAARHVYWLLLRNAGYTFKQIAQMNNRSHSCVLQSIENIKNLLDVRDELITELYFKTKHLIKPDMSRIKQILELDIPKNVDSLKSTISSTADCEMCEGKGYLYYGGWMSKFKKDIDDPDEQTCPCCQGSKKMRVEVLITWSPCDK